MAAGCSDFPKLRAIHHGHDLLEAGNDEVAGAENSVDNVYYYGQLYTGGDLNAQPAAGKAENRQPLSANLTSRAYQRVKGL